MATTSLTSRVTTRLPFQTLSPQTHTVEIDVTESAPEDADASIIVSDLASEAHPRWLTVATGLLIAENTVRVFQPLAIGLAINDLLVRSYQGLMILVGQHLIFLFLSSLRQMSVARQLNDIIAADVRQMTSDQRPTGELPDVTEQSDRLRERVDVLELALPEAVHIASTLCGALVLLAWYDWTLVPLCLVLVVPAVLLNTACGRKSQLLSRELMQGEGRESQILSTRDPQAIRQHFGRQNQARLQLANAEASSFCLMQLFVLGLLVTTLIHYCLKTSAQPGDIFAVLMYVLWYTTALNGIPVMIRQVMKLTQEV